ncbi:glycosyltransferase family 2 protein [bacterium]|nr:glycosyltransferase family 2 protein [bacterium]
MKDDPVLEFIASLGMRVTDPSAEEIDRQLERLTTLVRANPQVGQYLFEVMDKFEFNMWSGWIQKALDDIELRTCLVHQMLLLRHAAAGILSLSEDPDFRDGASGEKPPVSIIIPAWNQWEYTKGALESLFERTVWPDYEVIVIDNGSEDDTPRGLAEIASRERRLRVIQNRENLGFSGANNQGAEAAAHEHLIFLNNDVFIHHPDWIGQMMRSFLVHPRVGATGQFAVLDCFAGDSENLYQKVFFPGISIPVSWISGYNLLTRRQALKDAGGWRGDLYGVAGYEDIHLGYALREAGWFCVSPREIPLIKHLIGKTRFTDAGKDFVASHSPREDKHRIFRRHFGSRRVRLNLFLNNGAAEGRWDAGSQRFIKIIEESAA